HGIDDEQALACSDAICTGLQLTNFWQDFSVDLPNMRCYLATEWLDAAHISREDLLAGKVTSQQLQPAIQIAIQETQQLFDMGHGLLPYLPFRLRLQIAATLAGGMRILAATSKLDDPLHQRPTLTKLDWFKVSVDVVLKSIFPHYFANKRGNV
ncbi:MAG: squalene/phytoene synthase family protein, partial [Ghiorsea sp.]